MSDYVIRCATLCFTCTHTPPDEKNTSFMTKKPTACNARQDQVVQAFTEKKTLFFLHHQYKLSFYHLDMAAS